MPTGYTAPIADGITFKQFALQCARAFGATIMMRDDPADAEIPEEFKPSDYHDRELTRAKEEMAALQALSDAQWADKLVAYKIEQRAYHGAEMDKLHELLSKYSGMLKQVEAWTPPSSDHEGMKKFMVDQITESIEWDCNTEYHGNALAAVEDLTPEAWKTKTLADKQWAITYHEKGMEDEYKRVAGRNDWIRQLRSRLEHQPTP